MEDTPLLMEIEQTIDRLGLNPEEASVAPRGIACL